MMSLSNWMPGKELVKHVVEGDRIECDMGYYSHWGIYVGEQSSPGSSTGTGIIGDFVHLTKEDDEVVLEWLHEQKMKMRKNNIKDDEMKPKDTEYIVEDAISKVGVKGIYHLGRYNCEHFTNDIRYRVPVSDQVKDAKDVYSEASEGSECSVAKLTMDIITEVVTYAEPTKVPKSKKFSEIITLCPEEVFDDQDFKDNLAALKHVKDKLDRKKLDLRKNKIDEETKECIRNVFAFKEILLHEPSSYLKTNKCRDMKVEEVMERVTTTENMLEQGQENPKEEEKKRKMLQMW